MSKKKFRRILDEIPTRFKRLSNGNYFLKLEGKYDGKLIIIYHHSETTCDFPVKKPYCYYYGQYKETKDDDNENKEVINCHGKGTLYHRGFYGPAHIDTIRKKFRGNWINGEKEKGVRYSYHKHFPNTVRRYFNGSWENGKREGKGTIYFDDGGKFVGTFKNGRRHGPGVHYCREVKNSENKHDKYGDSFQGEMMEGKLIDNICTYYYSHKGEKYMVKNVLWVTRTQTMNVNVVNESEKHEIYYERGNIKRKIIRKENEDYITEIRYRTSKRETFISEIFKGMKIEDNDSYSLYKGIVEDKNKNYDRYEGTVLWGRRSRKRHGKGTCFYNFNKYTKYEGEWENGHMHGLGTAFFNDNFEYSKLEKYEGEWENNKQHGLGSIYYKNGNRWIGNFVKGVKYGSGTFYISSGKYRGSRYTGEYENDRRHGKGVFYYYRNDGDEIEIEEREYYNGKRINGELVSNNKYQDDQEVREIYLKKEITWKLEKEEEIFIFSSFKIDFCTFQNHFLCSKILLFIS